MMKNTILGAILLVASMAALGACSPAAPTSPTWEQDIHPLIVARCIRCHSEGGNVDPLTSGLAHIPPGAAFNFNYPTVANPPQVGLQSLKVLGPRSVRGTLPGIPRMPPAPAETLEDWQMEMLDNWAAAATIR